MLRRLVLMLALLGFIVVPVAVPRAQANAPAITVSPPAGSQFDTFVFEGTGFPAGMILAVGFFGPEGEEYTTYKSGQPITVTADADGDFALTVVPAEAFVGSSAGTWRAVFCTATASPDCWSGTFDISLR